MGFLKTVEGYLQLYGLQQLGQSIKDVLAELAFDIWNHWNQGYQVHILEWVVPVVVPQRKPLGLGVIGRLFYKPSFCLPAVVEDSLMGGEQAAVESGQW